MRRKSDRTANKKTKPSPEKKEKVEKVKRPRTRRRKQSTTSESESAEEPVQAVQKVEVVESQIEVPPKSVKEDSPEESQEQVWHVKATETSGDVGEIKKLKICLARPPSTPERPDRSPRSKRKHSRATSSSDTPSIEGEEKKKTRHRSKRGTFEAKDVLEKNQDSQGDEAEAEVPVETVTISESIESCKKQLNKDTALDETPMSTTCEDDKVETSTTKKTSKTGLKTNKGANKSEVQSKSSDADTTVVSPKTQEEDGEEDKEVSGQKEKTSSEKKEKGKSETKEKLSEIVEEESSESDVIASNIIDNKASSVIDEKPSSVIDEKSPSVVDEKPLSVIDEKPLSVIDEKPLSVIDEKPLSVIDEKPLSVIDEKPLTVTDEKPSSVIDKTTTSLKEEQVLPETKETDDKENKESSDIEERGKTEGKEDKLSEVKKAEDVKEEIKQTDDIKEDEKKPLKGKQASSEKEEKIASPKIQHSPIRKRSLSTEKSEILELHAEESRCESSEMCLNESQDIRSEIKQVKDVTDVLSSEVSINETSTEISGKTASSEDTVSTNENNVVENPKNVETDKQSIVTAVDNSNPIGKDAEATRENHHKPLDIHTPTSNTDQQDIHNGQAAPTVTSRKRRWGSRPSRLSTQKSITISTDVLKEIIPDVKPVEFDEVIEETKHKRVELSEKFDRPVLPKIVIDNTESVEPAKKEQRLEERDKENVKSREMHLASARKISIVKENDSIITRPPSPPRHKQSNILYITNLVRPFTLPQLKNLLQRTGRIMENGFWIDRIKSKCFVKYETEDQATETRHALHGVTWPVSNPKTLHVDFSTEEDFNKAQENVGTENTQTSTIPGTVEDWLREQDMKREKGDLEKPWEKKAAMREWDMGKNEKGKEEARPDKMIREERPLEKRRHRTPERSPEPARKFKKKEEEAPAKLLDDLFRKTKTTPCIYWLPLSAETIAVKEEQRRQHMAEHERRLQELRRNRRH